MLGRRQVFLKIIKFLRLVDCRDIAVQALESICLSQQHCSLMEWQSFSSCSGFLQASFLPQSLCVAQTVKAFSHRSLLNCTIVALCLIQPGESFLFLITHIIAISETFFSSSSFRKVLVLKSCLQFSLVYLVQTRHGSRTGYVEVFKNSL